MFLRPPHLLGVLILAAPVAFGQGADVARGAALYRNHCTACHESQVHIRERPKVRSLAELRGQVARWAGEIDKGWGNEEIDDVYHYLNDTYYHLTR